MTSPDWASTPTTPRRQGPRGSGEVSQEPSIDAYFETLIGQHDTSSAAHQFIQKMIRDALAAAGIFQTADGTWVFNTPGIPVADTTTRGISKLMDGSADFPLVPWASVSGKPTIPTRLDQLNGLLPTSALPQLAIVDYLGAVSSQTDMLALIGQRGDWCIRTDLGAVFIIIGDTPTSISSWKQIQYPTAPVTSVNNRTGAVTGLVEQSTFVESVQDAVGIGFLSNNTTPGAGSLSYDDPNNLFYVNFPQAQVQLFTANGTWTKPTGAVSVDVQMFSAGGGGGSGARLASGTASSGGAGGGGGGYSRVVFRASELNATEAITVGVGGAGGTPPTAAGNGNAGTNGGSSYFGSGPPRTAANGGVGGVGGSTATATGGTFGWGLTNGGAGGSGAIGAVGGSGGSAFFASPGGGAGGGLTTAPAFTAGGLGGYAVGNAVAGGGGGSTTGVAGGVGTSSASTSSPGGAGGGGASSATATGGNGGNGGAIGGAGGGGGSAISTQTPGAGGNGSNGVVVVVSYF